MNASERNAPSGLCHEILADARQESEGIVHRAREEAQRLLAQAAAEAVRLRQERLAQAQAEAARRAQVILATVAIEEGRLRCARLEAVLEAIRERIWHDLRAREAFGHREAVVALAAEAVSQMTGDSFVLKMSARDGVLTDSGLPGEIARRIGRDLKLTISEGPARDGGGVVVSDAEGRQEWDNSMRARLERLWPELRWRLAVQAGLIPGDTDGGAKA